MGESITSTTPLTGASFQPATSLRTDAAGAPSDSSTASITVDPVSTYKTDLIVVKAANTTLLKDIDADKPASTLQADREVATTALTDAYTQFESKMTPDQKLSIFNDVLGHTEHGERNLELTGASADGSYGGLAALTPGAYHALHNADYNTNDGLMQTQHDLRVGLRTHPENTTAFPDH